MAKIVPNESAPADLNSVSLANVTIEEFPFETNESTVLANAEAHPWLAVEYEAVDPGSQVVDTIRVNPEEDPLSAQHPDALKALDPEAAIAAEEEKRNPVAIEAGLDQNEPESAGPVALTLAAADENDDEETH